MRLKTTIPGHNTPSSADMCIPYNTEASELRSCSNPDTEEKKASRGRERESEERERKKKKQKRAKERESERERRRK